MKAMAAEATVWVVDDDAEIRGAIALLLSSAGRRVETCPGGEELLARLSPETPGCVLLDLRMPRLSGLEVQRELLARGLLQPVVFVSGQGDIPIAMRAVQAGALDFLEKPFREAQLLAAIERALDVDRKRRAERDERARAHARLETLTPREADVAHLIAEGLTSEQIAARLKLSRRTVDMHRLRLRKRLGVTTSGEIVRLVLEERAATGLSEAQSPQPSATPSRRSRSRPRERRA
jgi:FixJ family two-component response regulator